MKLGFIGTGNMAGAIMGGNGKKSCERTVWNPGDSG